MVAIVAGSGLGLFNTSLGLLGSAGGVGQASTGRSGEQVYINASTGNLVVRQQDEWLVGVGADAQLLRTYNSQATTDGDNNDNWRLGLSRRVMISGPNVVRVAEDGSSTTFYYDSISGLYISKDGVGAHDTMVHLATSNEVVWTDGTTGIKETYELDPNATGQWRLLKVKEPSGKELTLGYLGTKVVSIATSNNELVQINYYTGTSNIESLVTFFKEKNDGSGAIKAIKRVSYQYDNNRLSKVTVDLTPDRLDDAAVYETTYLYVDGTSKKLSQILQSDGSALIFTYDGERISGFADWRGTTENSTISTFSYGAGKTTVTTNTGGLTQITEFTYETAGVQNLQQLRALKVLDGVGGTVQSSAYQYDADGNVQTVTDGRGNVTTYEYDSFGNRTYERDAAGNVVTRVFSTDRKNLLLSETVYVSPDLDGAGTASQPSGPQTTRYAYDDQNNLRFIVSAEGRVTEHRYESTTNGAGQRTSSIQYAANRYSVTGLTPSQQLQLADLQAWLNSTTTPVNKSLAQRTDFTYDFRGQLDRQITYTSLNAAGNGIVSDGSQTSIQFVYDQAGNLLQSIDSRGDELATRDTLWAQQVRGQMSLPATSAGLDDNAKAALRGLFTTTYQYDGLNRLTLLRNSQGDTQTLYADGTRQTLIGKANGLWTVNVYDQANRLLSSQQTTVAGADFGTTTYTYDTLGRLRAVTSPGTDASGRKAYFIYDKAGRLVGEISRDGALTETVYNGNNQVIRKIRYATMLDTALVPGDGTSLTMEMVKPLVLQAGALDRTERTLYDKSGRVSRTIDAQGAVVDYQYDGTGWLSKKTAYAVLLTPAQLQALVTAEAAGELDLTVAAVQSNSKPTASVDDRATRSYHDAEGLLTGTVDAENYFTKYTYDDAGRLTGVTRYASALQNTAALGSTIPGIGVQSGAYVVADIKDQTTTQLYNAKGLLVGVIDAGDFLTEFSYDTSGRKVFEVRYANIASRVAGAGLGQVRPAASTEDQKTYYQYDQVGQLVATERQPDGLIVNHTYDAVGQLLQTSHAAAGNAQSRIVQRRYDVAGRMTNELSAQGSASVATDYAAWLAANSSASQSAKDDKIVALWATYGTRYTYDVAGRLTASISPDGVGATGLKTLYYYDAQGRVGYTVNAIGEVTRYVYNAFGEQIESGRYRQRLAEAGAGGFAKTFAATLTSDFLASYEVDSQASYNRLGKIELSTVAGRAQTFSYYNAFGEVNAALSANGTAVTRSDYLYDRRGLRLSTQNDTGGVERLIQAQYDAFGRVTKTTDARGVARTSTFDRLGREIYAFDSANFFTQSTYDAFGRVLTVTDRRQATTGYVYDSSNRKLTVTTQEGIQTITEANVHGEVVKVTVQHKDKATSTTVDALSRVTVYDYNADGQVTSVTSAHGSGAQTSVTTEYDKAGRVFKTTDAGGTITQTTYDAASRVMKRQVDPAGLNLTSEYFYDAKGQAAWVKDPTGVWTQTEYDSQGRVKSITVDPRKVPHTGLTYDARTPLDLSTLVNNPAVGGGLAIRTEYTYDTASQVVTVAEGVDSTLAASDVQRYAKAKITNYVYDALGRRIAEVADPKRTPLAVLGVEDHPGATESRTTYSYDKNGNVIARMDALGNTTRYVYNDNNQLTHTVDATGAITQNTYDANGRLTQTRQYSGKLAQSLGLKVWSREGTESLVQRPLGRFLLGDVVTVTVRFKAADNTKGTLAIANAAFVGAAIDTKLGTRDADGWQTLTVTYTLTKDEDLLAYLGGDRGGVNSSDGRHVLYDNLVVSSVKKGSVLNDTFDSLTLNNPQVATSYLVSGQAELANYVKLDVATITDAQIRTSAVALADADKDQTTTYVYNNDGQLTHTIDALNYVTKRAYDAAGNVVQTTRYATALAAAPAAAQVSGDFKWFAAPSPSTHVNDRVERFAYDQANRLIWSIDAAGYATQTSYEESGLKITQKRYTNAVVYADSASALKVNVAPLPVATPPTSGAYIVKDDAKDRTQVRQLDALGREKSVKDAGGYLTTKTYDLAGRLKSVTRYTEASSLTQDETDIGNAVQRFDYDSAGRQVKATDAEGAVTLSEYDLAGNMIAITRGHGSISAVRAEYVYDGAGRLLQETVGAGRLDAATTRYELDGVGQRTKVIDPRGIELAEGYSEWAQALRKTLIGTHLAPVRGSSDYRKLTNVYASRQEFDARGQVMAGVDALGGRTLTEYDAFGHAVKVVDPKGQAGYFYFDRLGQRTWSIDPLGYATQTVYDGFGQVSSIVKYTKQVGGTITAGQPPALYDTQEAATAASAAFYLVKQSGKDATTSIAHDKVGRQTTITDAEGFTESNGYNGFGDKTSFTAKSSTASLASTGIYTYTYDKLGRVLTEKSPVLTKQLDAAGNIKLTAGQPTLLEVITAFKYDSRGNVTRKTEAQGLVEQRVTDYTYDKQNRLTGQTKVALTMVSVMPDGTATTTAGVVPTETRNYDQRGNLIELYTNAGERTLYYYDAQDRRVAQLVATGPRADGVYGAYVEFEYDKAGNIVKQSAYSSLLKLPMSPGGAAPRADINTASDRITYFEYDANNLLRSQTVKDLVAGKINAATGNYELTTQDVVTRYTYDAAGNQTSVEDGRGNKTYFYYDAAGQRIAQVDAEKYITVWSYDDKGNVTLESKASTRWAGADAPTAAAGAGLPAAVAANTYGDKRTMAYTYDRLGRVKTQTIKAAVVGSFLESPSLITPAATDVTTSYDYNGLGAVIKKTEATGDTLLWEFDAAGREKRRRGAEYLDFGGTDLVRRTEDTEYNALGNKLRRIEQDKVITSIDSSTDRITNYFYSENGYLTKEVDAAGNAVSYQYDIAGRVAARSVTRQDSAGASFTDTVLFGYDVAGRQVEQYVISKTGANAAVTVAGVQLRRLTTQYSAFGDIASKALNGEVTETATYDTAGRLLASKAANGVPTVYLRDASGNITMTITPPADEQTAATASAMADFFKYEAYSVEDINAAINAGAHANVAVFDKRNLQTDAYELTSLPVMTNDGGIVEANGLKAQWIRSETIQKTTQILTDNGVWVNFNIDMRYWYSWKGSKWSSGKDYYLDRVEWTASARVDRGNSLPGTQYIVNLHVDDGFHAVAGGGYMAGFDAERTLNLDESDNVTITVDRGGRVWQDYGGVTGVNFHISLFKQINPTAPTLGKVELARWANSLSGFDPRAGTRPTWGNNYNVQTFIGQIFAINDTPVGTSQILFQYRSPGATTWRQTTASYQGGVGTISRNNLNFTELMALPSKSGYLEYSMTMVDASGAPLEFRQGQIYTFYDNASQGVILSYGYTKYGENLQNPYGTFFMGLPKTVGGEPTVNFIHPVRIRKSTDPKGISAKLKYRAEGQTAWTSVPTTLASGLTSDWFSFDPAALGMNVSGKRYEVMLEVKDGLAGAGNTLYTVSSDFFYFPPSVSTIQPSVALSLQGRPTTFNFTNIPLAAATARVEYTVMTPTGTTTGQANLVKTDDGRFYWDASTITPSTAGGTKYTVDYKLFAYAANNDMLVNGFVGREVIGAGNNDFTVTIQSLTSSSTTYSRTSSAKVTLAVGSAWRSGYRYPGVLTEIKNLSVYYRRTGTQTAYTNKVIAGNVGPSGFVENFTLDLSAELGTTNEYLDFDVYYEYNISPYLTMPAPTASDPIRVRVVNEATAQATLANGVMQLQAVTNRLTSNHQRAVYNAYGEVVQEFDAESFERIRTRETALGRALTAAELDDEATSLSYNSMGLLTSKRTPKSKATLQSGWETAVKAETTYIYDKQGRLLAEQDANGNQISYKLLAAGNGERIVALESQMDGGKTTLDFDVFGDVRKRTVTNDVNAVTDYTYDQLHRLVRAEKPTGAGSKRATDLYTYDSVGNQIKHQTSPDVSANASNVFVNGRIYAETTKFDSLGRVTEVRSGIASGVDPLTLVAVSHVGLVRAIAYEYVGATMHQTFTDENGYINETWTDAFGRQTKKIDLGGRNALMTYNLAGNMVLQYQAVAGTTTKVVNGQDITYRYYGNGQIKSIGDRGIQTLANYEYDRNGNKTYEGYGTLDGLTPYQRTNVVYDELNRIVGINDYHYSLIYEYDKVGNRRHVAATRSGETAVLAYWYDYDNMNRMVVSMGKLSSPRALSDTGDNRITQVGSDSGVRLSYDRGGNRKTAAYSTGANDAYSYTADGFLTTTTVSGTTSGTTTRTNDLLGRVTNYSQSSSAGLRTQKYTYLADGRVAKVEAAEANGDKTTTTNSYNALAGGREMNLLQTSQVFRDMASGPDRTDHYRYGYTLFDSAMQSEIRIGATSPVVDPAWGKWAQGVSQLSYDANGHVKTAKDSKDASNTDVRTITYVNNAQGQVLTRSEYSPSSSATVFQSYYYVNGRRVGESGNQPSASTIVYADALQVDRSTQGDKYTNLKPITSNFDQNYQPINESYPAFVGSTHVVVAGETLESIALGTWGDAKMWYLIAEANNILDKNARLVEGVALVIPNKVTNVHNSSATHKVYNAGEALGDISPTLPSPPSPPPAAGGGGCGVLGAVLMAVVAIAATVFTMGALGPVLVGAMGPLAGTIAAGAVAGAVGSIASQGVGLLTGNIDKFSWSAVASGAITGAVTAGIGGAEFKGAYEGIFASGNMLGSVGNALGSFSPTALTVAKAVTSNIVSQGVGVAVGLQKKFNWTAVAASGVSAAASVGASHLMGNTLGNDVLGDWGGKVMRNTVSSMTGGWAGALARHERPDWASIAADSFGNSLGGAIVTTIQQSDSRKLLEQSSSLEPVDGRVVAAKAMTAALFDYAEGIDRYELNEDDGEPRFVKASLANDVDGRAGLLKQLQDRGLTRESLQSSLESATGVSDFKDIGDLVNEMRKGIQSQLGLEDSGVRTALGKGLSLVFKGLEATETAVERGLAKTPLTAAIVGIYELAKNSKLGVGKFHELVVKNVLDQTGLFAEGSLKAIQNNSDQGIDLVGKSASGSLRGQWVGLELKASGHGIAPDLTKAQRAGPDSYLRSRLSTVINEGPRWRPGLSADTGLAVFAQQVLQEQGFKPFQGFVIQTNKAYDRQVTTTVQPWVNQGSQPTGKTPQAKQPARPTPKQWKI